MIKLYAKQYRQLTRSLQLLRYGTIIDVHVCICVRDVYSTLETCPYETLTSRYPHFATLLFALGV